MTIYREFGVGHRQQFVERRIPSRHFFPHRTFTIPKCGPDAFKLASRMIDDRKADAYWVMTLHATPPVLDELPREIFFDDDLFWHRQQYGVPGHVLFAMFVRCGDDLYGLKYVSDLVQRQSRSRGYRTQIESRFGGWPYMLINSLILFAVENGIRAILSPTAAMVMRHSDPARSPKSPLFERVYDDALVNHYDVSRRGDWWMIDIKKNRDRVVVPERVEEKRDRGPRLCITHDIERGYGHRTVDPDFADHADDVSPANLTAMLATERGAGVRATYNVVGQLFNDVHEEIRAGGHSIAFHSFNHVLGEGKQLRRCRHIDYRTRGYRVPSSHMEPELLDNRVLRYSFDWIASSEGSLAATEPVIRNGIAYIPILYDDFPLYRGDLSYDEWERQIVDRIEAREFAAIGLHDCYAEYWLPCYEALLDWVTKSRESTTLDRVADDLFLDHTV